jgi:hypothetical protein
VLKRRSCDAEAIALEQHGRKQASQRSASGLG